MTSTHLISSRSGEGVAAVASRIARERKGRDVFVVGAANVGKSAFVRALLKEMSRWAGQRGGERGQEWGVGALHKAMRIMQACIADRLAPKCL